MKEMKSEMEIRDDWYEFANSAYISWRGNTRKTLSEFAEWVGISQPLMSRQMKKNGSIPQDQKTISSWVNRYGEIIYDVLGLPIPDDPIDALPEPARSIAKEIRAKVTEAGITGDSPESLEIQESILKKFGFEIISRED